MKKTIFTLAIAAVIAGTMFTNCQSSATKVENAKDNVQDANEQLSVANQELNQARADSILQFKKESADKITSYDKDIAALKEKIATGKKETKAIYEKKLADIEVKNNELKARLENFKEDGINNWDAFKSEFNHDMDELGKALKDLTVKNVK